MKQAAITAIFLLLASAGAMAEMYKYTDENGQVVYTQFLPEPGVEAETIRGPAPPPSSAKDTRQNLIDDLVQEAEARQDRKIAGEKAKQQQTRNNQLKQNCEAARKNLKYLQNRDEHILVDKEGKVMDMSEEQRQQQIEKAKDIIKRDCK